MPSVPPSYDKQNLKTQISGSGAPITIDTMHPPDMKTFIYTPKVRVVIAHGATQVDVTKDIVRCSLHRAESSAASFFMTLANKNLKYTPKSGPPVFSRMDRIVVYMGRTHLIQVFSGYLDTVPYKQLYPGTVDFKATCTIKRLMHTWWNPAIPESQSLLNQTEAVLALGGGPNTRDSGIGSILRNVLHAVGGWQWGNIWIQNFPEAFYKFLEQQVQKNKSVNEKAVKAFRHMLLGTDTSGAPGGDAGHNPNSGVPGPTLGAGAGLPGVVGGGTEFYVSQIIAACDERSMGPLVSDNNQGAALSQVGATLEGSRDDAAKKAGQQLGAAGAQQQQANRDSDAAILGVACAAVETGDGVAIRNLYNAAAPGSDQYTNDGPGFDGSSCGIFQQQNNWGTAAQRMNPKQAAGMFFHALQTQVPGWREIDPGSAIQQVQQCRSDLAYKYALAIPWAKAQVLAQRTAKSGLSGAGATSTAGGLLGAAPSSSPNLVPGVPSLSPGGSPLGSRAGKPVPDTEGAINWIITQLGKPYIWGGVGPVGYDCSGLVQQAWRAIGISLPRTTGAMISAGVEIPPQNAKRGDLLFPSGAGHVVVWMGDGTILEAPNSNSVVRRYQAYINPQNAAYIRRAGENGGPDPSAPFNPPETMGPGQAPGTLDQQGGSGTGSTGSDEGIARNLFAYWFEPMRFADETAIMWPSNKAFLDGQPLIQIISALCSASLRKFQSAPNGDFFAYYPDYWGFDGKPAVMKLEDIELKDVKINFSDDPLTTHVYVAGDLTQMGELTQAESWMDTAGIATVEDDWLYRRLIKVAPGDLDATLTGGQIMRRFGVRPLKQMFALAGSYELELLLACHVFMEKWAQQYQTTISMTFMPELLPGMRVELAGHNLSVYVTQVTHSCDFANGFTTSATIVAPARPNGLAAMAQVTGTDPLGEDQMRAFNDPFGMGTHTDVPLAPQTQNFGG